MVENHIERLYSIWGTDAGDPTHALAWVLATIENKAEEGLYIDFKQKSKPDEPSLNNDDRANLAKAVSGFANTDGGLIVWGVKARNDTKDDPDVAVMLSPIKYLKTFQTQLNHSCGEVVIPPVAGVESRAVPATPGGDSGYVITVVPKRRNALIQANAKTCKGFHIRTGSGFHQLPEPLIAEFYRSRPSAILRLTVLLGEPDKVRFDEELVDAEYRDGFDQPYGMCTYEQSVAIPWSASLTNDGAGSASDIVIDLKVAGMCRWSIVGYRSRRHEHREGMSMIQVFEPLPETFLRSVKSDHGNGQLWKPLHPGQAVEVARGDVLIPLETMSTHVRSFEVVGRAYAKDVGSYPLEWQIDGSDITSRYATAFETMTAAAPPARRLTPKPPRRVIE